MPEKHDNVRAGVTWRDLCEELEALAAISDPTAPARPAMLDYLLTLRGMFW